MSVNFSLLTPLALFGIATAFTPGPNNLMLMTSGLNFGLKRTLPHLFGVILGFTFLTLCMGLGLGGLFRAFPVLYTILKYAGSAYMLYLAWAIAASDTKAKKTAARKRPFTFIEAAAFQWVNPKAWIMAVGAISTYAVIALYPFNAFIISGVFCVIGFGSSFLWAGFGTGLQHLLKNPKIVRTFNITMALLLAASIYPILRE
jgi:threonine/homoserine/homoserine lactone efflux protein